MLYTLRFFSLRNAVCFIMLNFGFCIIHILYTGCAKIKKNNSGAKGLNWYKSCFPRLKLPGGEVNWSPPTEVKNGALSQLLIYTFKTLTSNPLLFVGKH